MGRILNELEALGHAEDTLTVMHSDHVSYSFGLLCTSSDLARQLRAGASVNTATGKSSRCAQQNIIGVSLVTDVNNYVQNWELGARVPLIIRAPWLKPSVGARTTVLAELVDIFPTVSDLSGLPLPHGEKLDGVSLAPVLRNPGDRHIATTLKPHALSQYMRCPPPTANASMYWKSNACLMTDRTLFPFMGYSIRTAEWRYTEWVRWNGTSLAPIWTERVGHELYSHVGDDGTDFDAFENTNEVATADPEVVTALSSLLHAVVANQTRLPSLAVR